MTKQQVNELLETLDIAYSTLMLEVQRLELEGNMVSSLLLAGEVRAILAKDVKSH